MTADGVATTTVTVTVEDANGNLIPNAAVTLSGSGTGEHFGATSGTTNAQGVFTTTLSSTSAQATETITATEGGVHETTSVTFNPGARLGGDLDPGGKPGTVTADGVSTTTLTVTVEDAQGNSVPNAAVTLSGSGTGNQLRQPSPAPPTRRACSPPRWPRPWRRPRPSRRPKAACTRPPR